jgi:hypothetical protein
MSPEIPETPNSPASRYNASSTCFAERPQLRCTYSRMPGSTEPLRVAIMSPSSGVKPMVVSTDRPPSTAEAEHPLPRWQMTRRSSSGGRPSIAAARLLQ